MFPNNCGEGGTIDCFAGSVAVLVCVLNESFILASDADGLKVVELVVCKGILHTVAAGDLGHIIKGVVSVRNVGDLGAVGVLTCDLGGSARIIVLIRRLVPAAVGHFLIARGIGIYLIRRLVPSCIGLGDQVVSVFGKAKRTVNRSELAICKGRFGQSVAKRVQFLCKFLGCSGIGGIGDFSILVKRGFFCFGLKGVCRKTGLNAVSYQLEIIEVYLSIVIVVVTVK